MWQRNATGAELSISSSDAGSFKVTRPLSNPVEMEKKKRKISTEAKIELKGFPVMSCET